MAQKKKQPSAEKQKFEQKEKSSASKYGIIALVIIVAGFLVYNNFIKKDTSEMHYYKFKKEGELTISDSLGNDKVKIDVEIADDDYSRQLGLMNRKDMGENQGMLFIFNEERMQSFWMLNTLFSLDMIFINKDNRIVTIHKNTTPLSQQSYPSTKPALFVLEVVGGFSDNHNIKDGDVVHWINTK